MKITLKFPVSYIIYQAIGFIQLAIGLAILFLSISIATRSISQRTFCIYLGILLLSFIALYNIRQLYFKKKVKRDIERMYKK
ncbi:hypothetical protein [Alistipes sp. ZOR0009]|uniref:hypothetical protein n=1 Tax=Alistipes sp. ZOR0009 TaxID=1339253 RepID=UPI000645E064|nr:hypothetical protein [Alistipes sp. ZOR0009]